MSVKELTLTKVQNLPDTATFEDIYNQLYEIELALALEEADEDIREGRIMSIEEARASTLKHLEEKYANSDNTKS